MSFAEMIRACRQEFPAILGVYAHYHGRLMADVECGVAVLTSEVWNSNSVFSNLFNIR